MLKFLRKQNYGAFSPIFPEARTLPLHCMISGCGYSLEKSAKYSWDGLKRGEKEFTIFQYTISGLGALEYEGKEYILEPETAFLLHVPHQHRYFLPLHSTHWEFIYFSLVGREAIRIWTLVEKFCGPVAKIAPHSHLIIRLCQIYKSGIRNKITSPYVCSQLAYELLMLTCDELMPKLQNIRKDYVVEKAIKFALENFTKNVSVKDMADAAGLSRFHFSRVFKASEGLSPSEFLENLRMKKALTMIQNERLSIKEISQSCGYNDPSYFCKIFKKYFDKTPEKFRQTRI